LRAVLDMDTGVDDAVAMALAVNSPELDLLAVTTVAGNAPVECCTRNSLLILELLRARVPVSTGARRPLVKELLTAPEVHGPDGLGGERGTLPEPEGAPVDEPAHELICRMGREHGEETVLVGTGPLTNIARALATDPGAVRSYRRVVLMAGAFDVPGNTGPVAEFNAYVDPEAAEEVLSAGLDVTVVPLDATTRSALSREALESHPLGQGPAIDRPGRNAAAILYRALDYYIRFQKGESGLDAGYMHDPIAVAAAFEPSLLTVESRAVSVVADGGDRGRTVAGATGTANVEVATDFDHARLLELLEERVLTPIFEEPGPAIGPGP
jgi:inosine-uridine nucleoside N-ribohydrolase